MDRKVEYKTITTRPRTMRERAMQLIGRWNPKEVKLQRYEGDSNWTAVNDVN